MGVSSRRRSSMRCKATVRCGRSRWSCRYGAAVLQSTHCPVRTMDYSLADSCQQSPKRPLPLRDARWAALQAGPPPETHRQTWASSSHSGVNRRKSDLHEVRPVAQCIARHHLLHRCSAAYAGLLAAQPAGAERTYGCSRSSAACRSIGHAIPQYSHVGGHSAHAGLPAPRAEPGMLLGSEHGIAEACVKAAVRLRPSALRSA